MGHNGSHVNDLVPKCWSKQCL